ncbi:hypothetical protein [Ruegeria sp. 6PALISEP08]|uniref:hypothetical protein n=1 Tax=Ruegeria sp. 6PALISEP08 TaxID=1225660 RepID=UPI0012EE6D1F|nr:hypothetical protein [Ruegeria sp. 6PALISEP08]
MCDWSKMKRFFAVVLCVLGLMTPRASYACVVCTELPDASIADHILSADVIVLAGPASENPFRYKAKKILKGGSERLNAVPEIPFLIDSVTRRAFRSDTTRAVLLTYGPTYKDSAGRGFSRRWRRIFIMNPERREFLDRLQTTGRLWAYGETDSPERVLFFAEYLWHPDQSLHNMALVEIGHAPYALVRPIGGKSSTSQILDELNDLKRFAYRSAAIRLLGLQTDPQARSIVRSRFTNSLKSGGFNNYEWAIAGIEADKETAISAIGVALQDPKMTSEDRKSLIRALTEAGSTQPTLRPKAVQTLSEALQKNSDLAIQIAAGTRGWGQTALHQQFEALAALEETDPATQFMISIVLGTDLPSE